MGLGWPARLGGKLFAIFIFIKENHPHPIIHQILIHKKDQWHGARNSQKERRFLETLEPSWSPLNLFLFAMYFL